MRHDASPCVIMMNASRSIVWVLGAALLVVTPAALTGRSFEPFAYPAPVADDPAGGVGWSGPWRSTASLTQPVELAIESSNLEAPRGYGPDPTGGCLTGTGLVLYRGLAIGKELDLGGEQAVYVSFLASRSVAENADRSRSFHLSLMAGLDTVIGVGHSSSGRLSMLGEVSVAGEQPAVGFDQTYLWVVRITAPDMAGRRRVAVYLHHTSVTVESHEPSAPQLLSDPFESEAVIDRIGLTSGQDMTMRLDELRIGSSWTEVTRAGNS